MRSTPFCFPCPMPLFSLSYPSPLEHFESPHRRLTDMSLISTFVHLRFLDISSNYLSDLSPLSALTQLLWLKASIPTSTVSFFQQENIVAQRASYKKNQKLTHHLVSYCRLL